MIAIKLMDTGKLLANVREQWEKDTICDAPDSCYCAKCRAGAGRFYDGDESAAAGVAQKLADLIRDTLPKIDEDGGVQTYLQPYAEETEVDSFLQSTLQSDVPRYRTGSGLGEYDIFSDGVIFVGRANSFLSGSEYVSIRADIIVTSRGFESWKEAESAKR